MEDDKHDDTHDLEVNLNHATGKNLNLAKRSWLRRFRASSAHNQANIVFSALIMIATISYSVIAGVQLHIMRKASEDSATQTQHLIDAANINATAAKQIAAASKRNAEAAEKFSVSAGSINTRMGEAVGKLQAQASHTEDLADNAMKQVMATNRLAEAAQRSADIANKQVAAANSLAEAAQRSADSASKQLGVMQAQFETSQRPWMSIASASVHHFEYLKNPSGLSVIVEPKFTIKNIGNLPAVKVRVVTDFFLVNWAADTASNIPPIVEAQRRQNDLCRRAENDSNDNPYSATLFPSTTKDYEFGGQVTFIDKGDILKGQFITPMFIGCILYRFSSSTDIHQTGFIYFVYNMSSDGGYDNLVYGQTHPANEIYLIDVGELAHSD